MLKWNEEMKKASTGDACTHGNDGGNSIGHGAISDKLALCSYNS